MYVPNGSVNVDSNFPKITVSTNSKFCLKIHSLLTSYIINLLYSNYDDQLLFCSCIVATTPLIKIIISQIKQQ